MRNFAKKDLTNQKFSSETRTNDCTKNSTSTTGLNIYKLLEIQKESSVTIQTSDAARNPESTTTPINDEEGEGGTEGDDDAKPAGKEVEKTEEEEETEEEGSGIREDESFDIFPQLQSRAQKDIELETNLNHE